MSLPLRPRATISGFVALSLWSAFGVLTSASGTLPPFETAALAFGGGGVLGLLFGATQGWPTLRAALQQPPRVWALGLGGLFGYHALYFAALRLAPPAEAGLLNYLWPLLLALGVALLPGDASVGTPPGSRPTGSSQLYRPVLGALIAFSGVALLLTGGAPALLPFPNRHLGDALAAAAAVVWAAYSLASRRLGEVPSLTVSGFAVGTGLLATVAHLLFETTVWPADAGQWAATVALAAGPAGLAYPLWDRAMKHGDLRTLTAASYLTPVASTALLLAFGYAAPAGSLIAACTLVVLGAVVSKRA